ncbi:sugar nucleotide-binding protein [Priestia megaterium]|uniref:sugar nucleotide-binding protein n=1 Tax=Priestia megaterium TaxID=1404 RepID=UPI000472FCCC|nr:sugar nucleotide-binding protein [Priestia megaterium]
MKILIIGGDGMAGHLIKDYFLYRGNHEIWWTTRKSKFSNPKCLHLDVNNTEEIKKILIYVKPDIVINAVGVLNNIASENILNSIFVNSILPHQLSDYSYKYNFYLIHISTDCVFSGTKGDYNEYSPKDGSTIYAQTKSLGEVISTKNLTIRTSIIGPELKGDGIGLYHWFMSQKGQINGYKNVYWNGVTTLELAKVIHRLLSFRVKGLIHITADKKISKYDLLLLLKNTFFKDNITITPSYKEKCDKSLCITRKDINYIPKSYPSMLFELKKWMEDQRDIYERYLN